MHELATTLALALVAGIGVVAGVVVGGWILLRLLAAIVARLPDDA